MMGPTRHGSLAKDVLDHRPNSPTCYMTPVSRFLCWNMTCHLGQHLSLMMPCHSPARPGSVTSSGMTPAAQHRDLEGLESGPRRPAAVEGPWSPHPARLAADWQTRPRGPAPVGLRAGPRPSGFAPKFRLANKTGYHGRCKAWPDSHRDRKGETCPGSMPALSRRSTRRT